MSFWYPFMNGVKNEVEEKIVTSIEEEKPEEPEYIWVEGYKATNIDMTCLDFQYELGVQYDLPEGEEPILCEKGFHFCSQVESVKEYYPIGSRVFKVKALVLETEWNKNKNYYGVKKFVAKSIILTEELPISEVVKIYEDIVAFLHTEEDYLSYVNCKTNFDDWAYQRFSAMLDPLSDNLKLILFRRHCIDYKEVEDKAKEYQALIESGISHDMALYLVFYDK